MILRFVLIILLATTLLLIAFGLLFPFFALPGGYLSHFLFALEFGVLLVAITTQCIKIICVVLEHVVFIFAAVRGLLPETMSCRIGMWRRMSITKDRGREHQHRPKELNILVC